MTKLLKPFILFNLVITNVFCFAQHDKMNKNVRDIVSLGKEVVVQLALSKLSDYNGGFMAAEQRVTKDDFSSIKVLTNGREVLVSFTNSIKYLSPKTAFYASVVVNVSNGSFNSYPVTHPVGFDNEKPITFYRKTKESNKHIQFVIEAINKSDEIGAIDVATFQDDMTIYDYESHYEVSVVSAYQESTYKIEKKTGRVYDASHAHFEPAPFDEENEYIEIDWDKIKDYR